MTIRLRNGIARVCNPPPVDNKFVEVPPWRHVSTTDPVVPLLAEKDWTLTPTIKGPSQSNYLGMAVSAQLEGGIPLKTRWTTMKE